MASRRLSLSLFLSLSLLCLLVSHANAQTSVPGIYSEQFDVVRRVFANPIASIGVLGLVAISLLVWLKKNEGLTLKNVLLVSVQCAIVFFAFRHCVEFLTWVLDFDWSFVTSRGYPNPRGLLTGLLSVVYWHAVVLSYYAIRREMDLDPIQRKEPRRGSFLPGVLAHFTRPEAFLMVFGYLCGVWMFRLLPESYYDFDKPVSFWNVFVMFVFIDFLIFTVHYLEHVIIPLYRIAHKQHHFYINPTLFDAFSGSITDTFLQIVVPLYSSIFVLPALNIHISNWDFVLFGSLYANQFMLLHIEYRNPWDFILETFSIGTSEDHNVHHATFNYNYGHFFMIFDKLFGTYKSALVVRACVRYGFNDAEPITFGKVKAK